MSVCALVVYLLRWELFGAMVERAARTRLAEALDAEVQVGSCSGTLLTNLEFRRVRISPRDGSAIAEPLEVNLIRLEYSPLRLIFGGTRPLGKVKLEGVALVLKPGEPDSARPSEESFAQLVATLRTAHRWPSIEVRDISLRCGDARATKLSGHLLLSGGAETGSAALDLRAGKLALGDLDLGELTCTAAVAWPGGDCDARLDADLKLAGRLAEASVKASVPLGRPASRAACELALVAAVHDADALAGHFSPLEKFTRRLWKRAGLRFSAKGPSGGMIGSGSLVLIPAAGPATSPGSGIAGVSKLAILYRAGVLQIPPATLRTAYGPVQVGGRLPLRLRLKPLPEILPEDDAADLHARLEIDGFDAILPHLPPAVREMRPGGRLAITGRLRGTLWSPKPSVEFAVSDGSLRPADPLAPVENLSAVAVLTPDRLVLKSLSAQMGHRPVSAAGEVRFDGRGRVDGRVSAENALLVSSKDGTIRLRINADLRVSGNFERVKLSGKVEVPMLQYYREFVSNKEQAGEVRGVADRDDVLGALAMRFPHAAGGGIRLPGLEGADLLDLDVRVRSSGEIRLENSTIGALLHGRLQLKGTAARPSLSGEIGALSGEVRLFPGTFLPIRRLAVGLPDKSGAEPYLSFESLVPAGRTRVFVRVAGPLAAPRLQLSSDPPYPQDALLALLAYGRTPGAAGPGRQSQALLGQASRLFGGFLRDRMPRAEPGDSVLSRLVLDLESGGRRTREGSAWQRPEHGTVMFAEYIINDHLSAVTERDDQGRINADLQLRLRWPRRERSAGPSRKLPAGRPVPSKTARGKDAPAPVFWGNRAFASRRLLQVLRPDTDRLGRDGWDRAAASDAEFRLRHFYLEAGYYFVGIRCDLGGRTAVFDIQEGPLVRLGKVEFAGAVSVLDSALRKALFADRPRLGSSPFTVRLLKAQAESLLAYYREEGYLRAEVRQSSTGYDAERRRMNVTHVVREGPRFTLERVTWTGVGEPERVVLAEMSRTHVGRALRASLPDKIAFAARDHFRESGRPAARAAARLELNEQQGLGRLTVEVSPGPLVRIRRIDVSGNRRVRSRFIKRAARLREGKLMSQSRIRRAEKRLADTGLFREVRSVPLRVREGDDGAPGAEQLSDLRLEVEEAEPHELKLRLGYGAFERVRAGAELGTRNAFGNGESLSLGARASERGYRLDGEAGMFPSPGLPLRAEVRAFYEEREDVSYDLRDLGVSPSLSYMLTRRDEVAVGVLFEWIDTDDVSLGVPVGDQETFRLAAPFVSIAHDRRDSRLLPRRGYLLTGRVEFADAGLFGDISYWRASAAAAGYVPFGPALTLAASLKGGVISPTGNTREIPIALRYFAGGAGTVRGFEERELGPKVDGDPTGGEAYLSAQTELRFRIWRGLHGAVFFDAGNVYARTDDFDREGLRYGTGLGLRYNTPAGAIGLDAGFNPDREEGEDRLVLHIVFGLFF